jgi:hypothetical protein
MLASSEPAVISRCAPRRSSHRPTGIDITPLTRIASVSAPAEVAVEIPRSALIGPRKTPKT